MKFMKYLIVLAFALSAIPSVSHAQTAQFLGGGSSALFLELGQGAATSAATSTPCLWTQGSNASVSFRDNRPAAPVDETGNIWITWSTGSGSCAAPTGSYNVYAYMSLDSVIGDRCYFEVDASGIPGCVFQISIAAGTPGANKLGAGLTDTAGGIPAAIIGFLNGKHSFAAGTDIRPEDAKFASLRMFTSCGTPLSRQPFDQGLRLTYGLGYQTGTPGVGTTLLSDFSAAAFHVLDFNISGFDPIKTTQAVPAYSVSTVGAQPIIVSVSPAGGTGLGAATDINGFTLTLFQQGVLGRATDLIGPTSANTVTTLVREPLSGTYNVMEYSIPNSSQFHGSQDDNNCNGAVVFSNPLHLQSTNGSALAFRRRVIGTGEMVANLQAATTDTIGYWFWSAGNAANFTAANGKYLTVNGVDPIQNAYSTGVIPNAGNGGLPNVTFKWLNQGDYPVWSALRIVSQSPTPVGVTNLVSAAQTINLAQSDFITLANLKVWHSHYYLPAIGSGVSANGNTINTANDLCNSAGALGEFGGDAGGSNVLKQANHDFCSDFGNINGLINKAN